MRTSYLFNAMISNNWGSLFNSSNENCAFYFSYPISKYKEILINHPVPDNILYAEFDCTQWITPVELFREVSAKLEFPDYFGNNWDALQDCLTDFIWSDKEGFLLVFFNFLKTLPSNDNDFLIFLDVLSDCCEYWNSEDESNDNRSFHVFLHSLKDEQDDTRFLIAKSKLSFKEIIF